MGNIFLQKKQDRQGTHHGKAQCPHQDFERQHHAAPPWVYLITSYTLPLVTSRA